MAGSEERTKDQAQLLAEAWQARKDVLETILNFIPEEEEPKLTSVFPQATHLLALALAVAWRYTNDALRNIHTQLSDLVKEHVPEEHAGAFFNTILQVTCSFRQEMDNMATNQVFLLSQIVPNLWGSHRDYWRGYPSWNLLAARPAGQPHWWSVSQPYLLPRMCWCTVIKVPHTKKEGSIFTVTKLPSSLSLRGRGPYHFPTPLNT